MTYPAALQWLSSHVPRSVTATYPGQQGLDRTRQLLALLGNPQDQIFVIHVAGTSGKGSTAAFIAAALRSHGFRVGLSIKPYIFDVRERFQINGKLGTQSMVARAISQVRSAVDQMCDQPSYFEVLTVIMYHLFASEHCRYAVVETGLGGTFDATNTVNRSNKMVVLTRVGHDHTRILGQTLKKIAVHKAGIIHSGNLVFTLNQSPSIQTVIRRRVRQVAAILDRSTFQVPSLRLSMIGTHQQENAHLALRVVAACANRDGWSMDWSHSLAAVSAVRLPARSELGHLGSLPVFIDGAHNPQKMRALTQLVADYFGSGVATFLVAFKAGKDVRRMLVKIGPVAHRVILTTFTHRHYSSIRSLSARTLESLISSTMNDRSQVIPSSVEALKEAVSEQRPLVITGSLYFCATMYSMLYTAGYQRDGASV
ncbi:hypothetical protein HY524_02440 [Candidatus Berkelbacteria bacterium]|nr:hypothetical protein [Candidatus Berkelbacteria bacterium]